MSPGELVRALLRRWYVLVLAVLLTAAGAYQVLRPAQSYLSSAVVVLKPPVTDNQPNQLANLQPPLAAVSYAIIQQMESSAGEAELAAAGVHGTYKLIPRNSGTSATPRYLIPSLQVQAEQPELIAADAAVRQIIEVYTKHLQDMQTAQGIPSASRMSVDLLVPPSAAAELGTKSRGLAGVALLGAVGGVLAALWTDQFLNRRRLRRGADTARPRPAEDRIQAVPLPR
ncbi:hypothetical protein [Streptomyces sp. RKAG337]|uniref:hypothetical protein n=1 Tax=Streptomyces sp. RKAG337 TaxID=2893404 RepID=UPI0020344C0B|nr:hypothetical protein [Streptomyces sp. RKAG337]MCM2424730.1 hypothetical protein [Streptomyces sp. RKAG337]